MSDDMRAVLSNRPIVLLMITTRTINFYVCDVKANRRSNYRWVFTPPYKLLMNPCGTKLALDAISVCRSLCWYNRGMFDFITFCFLKNCRGTNGGKVRNVNTLSNINIILIQLQSGSPQVSVVFIWLLSDWGGSDY